MTIKYNFTQLHQLADDLNEEFKVLQTQSDTLHQEVETNLVSAWQSPEALDAYLAVQRKWDGEFENTRELLKKLSGAVEESANKMRATDSNVGGTFGN